MTPKITLVTVVAVALVAVPAAWGGQAQSNPRGMLASDAVENVREQAAQSFNTRNAMASDTVDAALASERSRRATASSYASSGIGAVPPPEPVSTQGSGRDVEWPQIGIGFGLGIVLALGLFLAMRFTRTRQLAH